MATYTIVQQDLDDMTAANVTLNINGVPAAVNDICSNGDVLTMVADVGYAIVYQDAFTSSPVLTYSTDWGGQNDFFTLSENDTLATLTFNQPLYQYGPYGFGIITEEAESPVVVTGFNNVYEIDRDKLYEINDQRFEGTPPNVFDYGIYILSVIELPFTIPAEIKTAPEFVELGSLTTSTEADVIATDKIVVDLGEISISGVDSNLLDYSNTVALLHLPRTAPIALELEYVIDETISIEYIVDCYTGRATINISSTKIDEVISTSEVDLGITIPYGARSGNVTGRADNVTISVGGDNGVLIPFIELIKSNSDLHDSQFVVPVNDYGALSGETGFVLVDEIDLNFQALASEKDSIRQALQGGVIIK